MLGPDDFRRLKRLLRLNTPKAELAEEVRRIRLALNPHPGGQLTHNVPTLHGRPVQGIQHKYRETVLFFPSPGQTCHAYCTYCFRWAQFVGMEEFKFQASETDDLVAYFKAHPEVTDVLITGGDPMIMRTKVLRRYVEQRVGFEVLGDIHRPIMVCDFIQARRPDWVREPFFAEFDDDAVWFYDLWPAFGKDRFYFESDEDPQPRRGLLELTELLLD